MITFLICGIALGWVLGYLCGERDGWRDGIKVARHWEGFAHDWRMHYEMEIADTETERRKIQEVRELSRMYDGV